MREKKNEKCENGNDVTLLGWKSRHVLEHESGTIIWIIRHMRTDFLPLISDKNQALEGKCLEPFLSEYGNASLQGNSYSVCCNDCALSSALFPFKLVTFISKRLYIMWSFVEYETEMGLGISDRNNQSFCMSGKKKGITLKGPSLVLSPPLNLLDRKV